MKTKTALAAALCIASTSYGLQITDLGSMGEEGSAARAISESGLVVGEAWTCNARHTFVYDAVSPMHPIESQLLEPAGVNNSGVIIGTSDSHPVVFTLAVNTTTPVGGLLGPATAINNAGQVAGYFYPNAAGRGDPHAFIYDRGGLADLGCVQNENGCYSIATAINESGQVVGRSNRGAFIYSGGATQTFGGPSAAACSINNRGDVVGEYWNGIGHRAFVYSQGVFTEMTGDHSLCSKATDINDQGEVVGFIMLPPDSSCRSCNGYWQAHAFVYRNGALTDLNALLPDQTWELQYANAINNNGQIVGQGFHHGQQRAFLLTLD